MDLEMCHWKINFRLISLKFLWCKDDWSSKTYDYYLKEDDKRNVEDKTRAMTTAILHASQLTFNKDIGKDSNYTKVNMRLVFV